MTIQPNDQLVNTEAGVFAFFNDTIRNVIHGGVFTATDKGFVAGNMNEGTKKTVTDGYMGNSNWGSDNASVDTPLQTVNYASCHDNYTLFDNLTVDAMDMTGKTAEEVKEMAAAMNNLAAAYYITAQGVPFIHAGEEMLRSKPDANQDNGFNHNSYASGDEINSIKWATLSDELVSASVEYYTGLIAFRKAHDAMRMTTEEEILDAMSALETGNVNVVAVLNEGGNGEDVEILSIFNADAAANTVELPTGEWTVYVNATQAGTEAIEVVEGEVEVPATSAMILVKTGEGTPTDPSEPSDPTDPSDPSEPADPDAVNKTALKAAIDKAKALKKADYSNKSFEAMKSALAVAEKIYAKEDATQTEVDNALKALNAAIKALVPSTGKNPETGDSFQMTLFVTMAALSLMGGAALVLNRKKFF
jgi:hypothetical protein